jgi:hypothetical protein
MRVVLGDLGLHEGGALLVKGALRMGEPGGEIAVSGAAPELELHLRSWRRAEPRADRGTFRRRGFLRAECHSRARARSWGLAARGSLVESGSPEFRFTLTDKMEV